MNYLCIADDVTLVKNVKLSKFINLYGCTIGENTKIGAFVEIQKNAAVGKNCKISSHTFICEGVTIEDDVASFVFNGVTYTLPVEAITSPPGAVEGELVVIDDVGVITVDGVSYSFPVVANT